MARPQKRVTRKSNVKKNQCSQPANYTKKRKVQKRKLELQTSVPCKRRRSCRNKLRESNSVILVGETPCCQSPEQHEKYARLGLNSALFLKGTQRPKRKQSHISIITISSDDEETSEKRTKEWVKSLDQNHQLDVKPDSFSDDENLERNEQTFQPSSTPNDSQPVEQRNEFEKSGDCSLSSAEASKESSRHKLNESQEHGGFGSASSNEDLRGRSNEIGDQVTPEDTFQLVISIPDNFTHSKSVTLNQSHEPNNAEMTSIDNDSTKCPTGDNVERPNETNVIGFSSFGESLRSPFNFTSGLVSNSSSCCTKTAINTGKSASTNFYFGSSTDARINTPTTVLSFNSYFNNPMDMSSGGIKFGLSNDQEDKINQFDTFNKNIMENTSNQMETKSVTSDDPDILSEGNSQCNSS